MDFYEKEKASLETQVSALKEILVGARITNVEIPVEFPGQFGRVTITLDNGKKFIIRDGGGGCTECDPDGIGFGVNVELS